MLRRKHDFKPDRMGSGILNKLYITKRQRLSLLKWFLFGLVLLVISLLQDVVLCRVKIFGATTDLFCAAFLLLCIVLPTDSCAVFAVIGSAMYYFSGMAAGPYAILFLTGMGILLNIFRYAYLRKSFGSIFFCAGIGLMLYELLLFVTGLFLGHTTLSRFGVFCISGGISVVFMPLMYPIFRSISKIGGDAWKE